MKFLTNEEAKKLYRQMQKGRAYLQLKNDDLLQIDNDEFLDFLNKVKTTRRMSAIINVILATGAWFDFDGYKLTIVDTSIEEASDDKVQMASQNQSQV